MSPQVSKEEWANEEQIVYLTYREMAALIMAAKEIANEQGSEESEVAEVLKSAEKRLWVNLKPVLYDEDIEKLGGE